MIYPRSQLVNEAEIPIQVSWPWFGAISQQGAMLPPTSHSVPIFSAGTYSTHWESQTVGRCALLGPETRKKILKISPLSSYLVRNVRKARFTRPSELPCFYESNTLWLFPLPPGSPGLRQTGVHWEQPLRFVSKASFPGKNTLCSNQTVAVVRTEQAKQGLVWRINSILPFVIYFCPLDRRGSEIQPQCCFQGSWSLAGETRHKCDRS